MFFASSWDTKDYCNQVVQATDCRWCYSHKWSLFYSMQLFLFYFLFSVTFICPSVEITTNWHLLQKIKWDETWLFACIFDERTVILFNCLKFVYVVCSGCVLANLAIFFIGVSLNVVNWNQIEGWFAFIFSSSSVFFNLSLCLDRFELHNSLCDTKSQYLK